MPGEVRAPLQRDECRAWNRGRDLTPEPVRHGAVVATMHDQRRLADEGKLRAYVEAIDETQQGGSGLGGRRLPLKPCEAFVLRRVGTTEEDVTEQARAESPMRSYRRKNRVRHARSRDRCAIGIRPVQHQALDALRKCCGKCDGGAAPTTSRR